MEVSGYGKAKEVGEDIIVWYRDAKVVKKYENVQLYIVEATA